jgi:hypothetical protein
MALVVWTSHKGYPYALGIPYRPVDLSGTTHAPMLICEALAGILTLA